MKLIIMRHGKAEDNHPDGDHARALTKKGHRQAQRQAQRLAGLGLLPAITLSSPLMRARETAETFAQTAKIAGPMIVNWLASGMRPATAMQELTAYKEFGCVCIVGHEPDLSSLVAWLTESTANSIQMKKGAIAVLTVSPPSQHAVLEMLLPAKEALSSLGEF
jgi:phosphohistidine phosphatase